MRARVCVYVCVCKEILNLENIIDIFDQYSCVIGKHGIFFTLKESILMGEKHNSYKTINV